MKKAIGLILLSCMSLIYSAQSYAQTKFQLKYTGAATDGNVTVIENAAGNYIIAYTAKNGANKSDFGFAEIGPSGGVIRHQLVGSVDYEVMRSVCQTSDGGYLASGAITTTGSNYDWMIMKLDANFNLTWYQRHTGTGNDYANKCYELKQDRYLVTGTMSIGGSAKPSWLILDSAGVAVKEFYLNTNQFASPAYAGKYLGDGLIAFRRLTNSTCIVDTNGAVIVNNNTNYGIYSTDATLSSVGFAVSALADFGSLQGSTVALGLVGTDYTTAKFNYKYRLTGGDFEPTSVLAVDGGSFLVSATLMNQGTGNYAPYLFKVDSTGTVKWSYGYKPSSVSNCTFEQVIATSDTGYLAVGIADGNLFVSKMDTAGIIGCNNTAVSLTRLANSANGVTPHALTSGNCSYGPIQTFNATSLAVTPTVYCTTVGLESIDLTAAGSIRPSAFDQFFMIQLDNQAAAILTVYTTNGAMILNEKVDNGASVNTTTWAPGIYLAEVRDHSGKMLFQQKIVRLNH